MKKVEVGKLDLDLPATTLLLLFLLQARLSLLALSYLARHLLDRDYRYKQLDLLLTDAAYTSCS